MENETPFLFCVIISFFENKINGNEKQQNL